MTNANKGKKDISRKKLGENFVKKSSQLYSGDAKYDQLLIAYQNGEWDLCTNLLEDLLEKYSDNQGLLQFQNDIQIKNKLQQKNIKNQEIERREKTFKGFGQFGLIVLVIVILGFGANYSYKLIINRIIISNAERNAEIFEQSITSKYTNAENYLQAERYSDALPILLEIEELSPNHLDVIEMIETSMEMIAIEEKYQEANALFLIGELEEAHLLFIQIEENFPKYKDTIFKISILEKSLEINRLKETIQSNYEQERWGSVIESFENILLLDPEANINGFEEVIFISYLNLIIDTADRVDATIDDIDKAQNYYRAALALLPQNRKFADERAELEKVAITLLANKYYIYSLELLEAESYSPSAITEAIHFLGIAYKIDSDSPAIETIIEKLELFLSGIENIEKGRMDDAIEDLEQLYRIESDYADGFLQYLLFEAYIARGDILYSFGEYFDARSDFEVAETLAWGNYGNKLRLFNVEIRLSATLKRQFLAQEAAEYYNFSLDLIDFSDILIENGNDDLIGAYQQAKNTYYNNDAWNATQLFENVLTDHSFIYSFETIQVNKGDSLFQIAFEYGSMVDLIQDYNNFVNITVIKNNQEILIPILAEYNGN